MTTKKLTNEFMEKALNDSALKKLSYDFAWSEQMLEKCKNIVDWKEISRNSKIVWTPAMLDKFKRLIDWKELSDTSCETILTEDCLERFKDYWNWSILSGNSSIELDHQLIDKFIDQWDWSELINRCYDGKLYCLEFLERYADKIQSVQLQGSRLWKEIVEERVKKLKFEITTL